MVCLGELEVGLEFVERGYVLKDFPRLGRGVLDGLQLAPVINSF